VLSLALLDMPADYNISSLTYSVLLGISKAQLVAVVFGSNVIKFVLLLLRYALKIVTTCHLIFRARSTEAGSNL
jgi:Trk K+ transport system NAD-binding subunit